MIQELTKKVRKAIHGDDYEETRKPCGYSWKAKYDGRRICSEDLQKYGVHCVDCDGKNWVVEELETREVLLALMKKDIRFGDHTDDKSLWVKVKQGMEILPLTQQPKEWSEDIISKLMEIL